MPGLSLIRPSQSAPSHPVSMLRFVLALLALSVPAAAQTVYYVDDDPGPGIDFTDLQDAVNASSPGDRIEVFEGTYAGPVTIQSGVKVMAVAPGTVEVDGLRVWGLPAEDTVVLVDLATAWLRVQGSAGTVIFDGGRIGPSRFLEVTDSLDVRVRGTFFWNSRASITNSFVQIAQSHTIRIVSATDSEVVLTDCVVRGPDGEGPNAGCLGQAGDGGDAVYCTRSEIWAHRSSITGGQGGLGCWIWQDGRPGRSFHCQDSVVHDCRTTNEWLSLSPYLDSTSQLIVEDDLPSTILEGGNRVGEVAMFVAQAGVGTSTRIYAGREALRVPFGSSIDILHTSERGASLGLMVASESRSIPFTVPALARGTLIFIQVRRTLADGDTDNSNAVTLVVR